MTQPNSDDVQILTPIAYPSPRRTLVVLGAPRGGTSMVSGALHLLGVHMGQNIGHQKEDTRFREETPLQTKLDTIAENTARYKLWGWKLPNTIYYYDQVHPHLVNPVFVSVYRNPCDVARSSARHDETALTPDLMDVPIRHYAAMHAMLARYPQVPHATCAFETVSRAGRRDAFLQGMIKFLGLTVSDRNYAAALDFVDYGKGYQD